MSYVHVGLPFPRGNVRSDKSDDITLSDTTFSDLEGKLYMVNDTVHSTGKNVILRAVKNDTGSDITVARDCFYRYSTGANDFGRRIAGKCNAAGIVGRPIDDKYPVGYVIPDDDIFYVVEEGPCYVKTEASSVNLSAGDAVATDASGLVNGAAAAAGEAVLGTIDAACTTASTTVVVHVRGDVHKAEAAG